jgi:hypothetical protein
VSVGQHGVPCKVCRVRTYKASRMCRRCEAIEGLNLPDPAQVPENYLMRCAEELLRRHEARAKLLEQLGIRRAA